MSRTAKTTKTPKRRGARRAIVGAGLLLGALTAEMALAFPAFAYSPGDSLLETSGGGYQGYEYWTDAGDFWGDHWNTQGGGVPGTDTSGGPADDIEAEYNRQTGAAMLIAGLALQNFPQCRAVLNTHADMVGELSRAGRLIDRHEPAPTPADRPGVTTYAETYRQLYPSGSEAMVVELYEEFHTKAGSDGIDYQLLADPDNPRLDLPTLSADEVRALMLLHEIAHITNPWNTHRTDGDPRLQLKESNALNRRIVAACLRSGWRY